MKQMQHYFTQTIITLLKLLLLYSNYCCLDMQNNCITFILLFGTFEAVKPPCVI